MKNHKKMKYMKRIMIPFSVMLLLLTIIFYFLTYSYFIGLYTNTMSNIEIDVLEQKNNNMIYLTENIKSLSSVIRLNSSIMKLSYGKTDNLYELMDSQRQLDAVRMSSDLIQSIYLFNKSTGEVHVSMDQGNKIYKREDFFDKKIFEYMEQIKSYGTYTPTARKINLQSGKTANVLTFIMYDYFTQAELIDGVIVINVPMNWINKKLDAQSYKNEDIKKLILVDDLGIVTFSTDQNEFLSDKSGEKYVQGVQKAQDNKGSFIEDVDGKPCLITYEKNVYSGWTFIGTTNYAMVKKELQPVKVFTFIESVSIFTIGMIVLYVLSKRLARNFQKMDDQMDNLKEENRLHTIALRNDFISSLLYGNTTLNTDEMLVQYQKYGMDTNPSDVYFLVDIQIDNYKDFCKDFNFHQRNIKLKELKEIVLKYFYPEYKCDIGTLDENAIIVLCNAVDFSDILQISDKISEIIGKIQERVLEKLSISISAAVSDVGNSYRVLPYIYEEMISNLEYRYLMGHKSIIYSFMVPEKKAQVSMNDIKRLETGIINSLTKMKKEEMDQNLKSYISELSVLSPYEIKMIVMNMLMQIKSKLADESLLFDIDSFNMQTLISHIANSETYNETQSIISKILNEAVDMLAERKQLKYNSLIDSIKKYIQENYHMESLSINTIADNANLSIAYVGRIFKAAEGISIADYIIQIRLENAKHMLKETDFSVNEIAGKLGFVNSSYFYYVFKKFCQMTPNQFRLQDDKVVE